MTAIRGGWQGLESLVEKLKPGLKDPEELAPASLERYLIIEPLLHDLVMEHYPLRATWVSKDAHHRYVCPCPSHTRFTFTIHHHLSDNPGLVCVPNVVLSLATMWIFAVHCLSIQSFVSDWSEKERANWRPGEVEDCLRQKLLQLTPTRNMDCRCLIFDSPCMRGTRLVTYILF